MLLYDKEFRDDLQRIARTLTRNYHLQEELAHVGLIQVWILETNDPDHTRSWFRERCKWSMQDELRKGRSLDSFKRSSLACPLCEEDGEECGWVPEAFVAPDCVFSATCWAELVAKARQLLHPVERRIFDGLVNGLREREIAKALGVSPQAVAKQRKKIRMRICAI